MRVVWGIDWACRVQLALTVCVRVCVCVCCRRTSYDKLMPVLRGMISRCHTDKALRRLRGRTFECIGIIGSSVPVAKFKPDAVEVMRTMVTEQSKQMDAADPQRSSMWTTWGRIGSALKGDFATYLPSVMPALLVAAAETPMVKRVSRADLAAAGDGSDSDDSELEQFGDVSGGDWRGRVRVVASHPCWQGDHVLQVRTAALDDKSEAVNIIKCFADSLGATFYPYVWWCCCLGCVASRRCLTVLCCVCATGP